MYIKKIEYNEDSKILILHVDRVVFFDGIYIGTYNRVRVFKNISLEREIDFATKVTKNMLKKRM